MSTSTFPRTGVSYLLTIEHEYLSLHHLTICANCFALGLNVQLKRCNGCHLVDYCGRECQKQHWKRHKPFCNMVVGKGLRRSWLQSKEKGEVMRLVVDAYRLRCEIDWVSRGLGHGRYWDEGKGKGEWEEGLVWVRGDVVEDFQRWLDLCERERVLPDWWLSTERMECLGMALEGGEGGLEERIDQDTLMTSYGDKPDTSVRSGLLVFAELVVGYDGKGAPKDGQWYQDFEEHLLLNPAERARLIQPTIDAVKATVELHGKDFQEDRKVEDGT